MLGSSSKAGHVQSCLNMGGPPSKPKYSLPTDSEQVPWGKGEKHPDKGSEIDLKPDAYKQWERDTRFAVWIRDCVPFV